MSEKYWLTNVRLELGYYEEQHVVVGTKTELFHLLIEDGSFSKIVSAAEVLTDDLPKEDAHGMLLIPGFIEKHCHLDKTLLGDSWRPVIPTKDIFGRFEVEKEVVPHLPTTTKERAENLLTRYANFGVTHVRSHVDIYPEVGLEQLYGVQAAFQTFKGKLSHEIVAFPQHGLLRTNSQALVRQALKEGAGLVGGVDPATVDGNMKKSVDAMVELAVEGQAGIDLHLHDGFEVGIETMEYLAKLTKEAKLEGQVSISHAFALGDVSVEQVRHTGAILADAGIRIISSVPMRRAFPPFPALKAANVPLSVGCDNIFDVWSVFGNGDILERLSRLAEYYGWGQELPLSQALGYITDGVTALNEQGERVWPKVGDTATFNLVPAVSSAEVVARRIVPVKSCFEGYGRANQG